MQQFALTAFKLQMFDGKTCHVWCPIRACFFVFCPGSYATDSVGLERSIAYIVRQRKWLKNERDQHRVSTWGSLRHIHNSFRVHWDRNQKLINNKFIHKEKTKEIWCWMSLLISDEDTAKLYVQYFRPK